MELNCCVPRHWVNQPKFTSFEELRLSRKKEVLGEPKEISSKTSKFLEELEKERQGIRVRQGLNLTPQHFSKNLVEFKYMSEPKNCSLAELMQKRKQENSEENQNNSPSSIQIRTKLNPSDIGYWGKGPGGRKSGNKSESTISEAIPTTTYKTPSPTSHFFNSRRLKNLNVSLKPNEIHYESYENHSKFGKIKPFIIQQENFLEKLNASLNAKKIPSGADSRIIFKTYKNLSCGISKRLRHHKGSTNQPIYSSGFQTLCKLTNSPRN